MPDRRLFRGDPIGAGLIGLALGTTVGLLQWWGGILAYHDVRLAIGMGLVWSLLCARPVYRRGVERRAALVFFVCPLMAALLLIH